jgi:hypothetical protein
MMKVVVIPADVKQEMRAEEVERIDYDFLSKQVGGMIEVVSFQDDQASIYLNEEGKLEELPGNRRATYLAKRHGAISMLDYIAGDAVVVGPVDDEGNETGLEQEQIDAILEEIG